MHGWASRTVDWMDGKTAGGLRWPLRALAVVLGLMLVAVVPMIFTVPVSRPVLFLQIAVALVGSVIAAPLLAGMIPLGANRRRRRRARRALEPRLNELRILFGTGRLEPSTYASLERRVAEQAAGADPAARARVGAAFATWASAAGTLLCVAYAIGYAIAAYVMGSTQHAWTYFWDTIVGAWLFAAFCAAVAFASALVLGVALPRNIKARRQARAETAALLAELDAALHEAALQPVTRASVRR